VLVLDLLGCWLEAKRESDPPVVILFQGGGAYPNFMMDDEGDARLKATYGATTGGSRR
jgi:hypothetical protein